MARPLAPAQRSIPKLFHQSWSTTSLPAKFQKWSDGCREKHADWEWVLWTDDDNDALVKKFFPWLVPTFASLRGPIYRADLSRLAYMMLFGGVYADLDMDCLLPTDQGVFNEYNTMSVPHLHAIATQAEDPFRNTQNRTAFFGRMGTDPKYGHSIPNAWMASPPAHPLFFLMLEWTRAKIISSGTEEQPENITGPLALFDGIAEYLAEKYHGENWYHDAFPRSRYGAQLERIALPTQHDVVVLPPHYIYPYSWNHDGDNVRDVCWSAQDSFDPEALP